MGKNTNKNTLFTDRLNSFKGIKIKKTGLKNKVLTLIPFCLIILNITILLTGYIISFIFVKRVVVSLSGTYFILSVFIPFITWFLLTLNGEFTYHNKKAFFLCLVIINALLSLLQFVYTLFWDKFIPPIISIRITKAMTKGMVLSLCRLSLIIPVSAVFIILLKIISPLFTSKGSKKRLMEFSLKEIIDLRKNKRYLYDFTVLKSLKTGKIMRVKERDRFVHFLILGASGTGKTSSIYTPQIVSDIERKIKNKDMQQKAVLKMVKSGDIKIKEPFKIFNKRHFYVPDGKVAAFNEIFKKYKECGITVVSPNNSMNEDILKFTSARGIWVNNIDPTKKKATHPYERLCGMNPLYIPPRFSQISPDDTLLEEERTVYIDKAASNVSDALTAINELSGSGDQYFTDVNNTVVYHMVTLLMLSASIRNVQTNMEELYFVITAFSKAETHVNTIESFFNIDVTDPSFDPLSKTGSAREKERKSILLQNEKKAKNNPYYMTLLIAKTRLIQGSKMDEHSEGLRNLLGKIMQNPDVNRVLVTNTDIIDHDENLRDNAITLCNTALELGANTSTCFGQLFILNFNSAVLRRPKDYRTPHFFFEDETARYLSNTIDTMVTLYRQYNVSCSFALQSLAQPLKSQQTKYLKDILLDVGTLISFGATNVNDTKEISALSGEIEKDTEQKTKTSSSVFSTDPKTTFSKRTMPDKKRNVDESDVRFRNFQEFTFITRDEGRVVPGRLGKASFVPKEKFMEDKKEIRKNEAWVKLWEMLYKKGEYNNNNIEG